MQSENLRESTAERRVGALKKRLAAVAPKRLVQRPPTRTQLALLALVTLLALGPVVALVFTVGRDHDPVVTLLDGEPPPADGAQVTATLIGVSPTTGELAARIAVQPQPDLLDEEGRLTDDLIVRINDIRGQDTYEFAEGAPLQPVEVGLALSGGSIARYPVDRYDATLSVALLADRGREDEPVTFGLDIASNVDEFEIEATPSGLGERTTADEAIRPSALAIVDFGVTRETTTTLYAIWTMALMWALAIVGVGVLWAVIIWQVEIPWWGLAYFVGVLFALPQLREILPGRPPPGTLLDYVAFYWCIAILGVGLITLLAIWIQRTRPTAVDEPVDGEQ